MNFDSGVMLTEVFSYQQFAVSENPLLQEKIVIHFEKCYDVCIPLTGEGT